MGHTFEAPELPGVLGVDRSQHALHTVGVVRSKKTRTSKFDNIGLRDVIPQGHIGRSRADLRADGVEELPLVTYIRLDHTK